MQPFSRTLSRNDVLQVWKDASFRLFISYRDAHRSAAAKLADALCERGVTTFLAHDAIRPMSNWQREIETALCTMDALLAFVTEDFAVGPWTNQEVGFAMGRGTPIIALQLDRTELTGFLAANQAVQGQLEAIEDSADDVYDCLVEVRTVRDETYDLISALVEARGFDAAIEAFRRLDEYAIDLNESETERICEGYSANEWLHHSFVLKRTKELPRFLERVTGRAVAIRENQVELRD